MGGIVHEVGSFRHSLFDSMSSTTSQTHETLDCDHKFPLQTSLNHIVNLTHKG